ncbi:MAG TPA: O-antigen ligase family protein [Stellaceae bacterium]|nr:O-antigen ligase family protein [Stellaceae bacterium]
MSAYAAVADSRAVDIGLWAEAGLALCLFLLPPLLALAPRGAAPLAAVAGLFAFISMLAQPGRRAAALSLPAVLLGALIVWGGLSALWSLDPGRSLLLAARLCGLFAAGLALATASGGIRAPHRLRLALAAGTTLGIALALADLASAGGLSRYVSARPFIAPRLNQEAAWVALLLLPIVVLLFARFRLPALAAAAALTAAVFALDDTTAKLALAASLPVAALFYLRRTAAARVAAALAALAILTAPVTLPRLARLPGVFAAADAVKSSAGHRLLIWSFAGDRIAERPFLGWGLDSARAIPGGKDEIRPGQSWLPLHPHDGAIQVWLELGAPGAALMALFVGWLWLSLGDAAWPPAYAAAAAGSLTAALLVAASGWGLWEEWWIGTLELAMFAITALAPLAAPIPRRPHGWRAGGRSGRAAAS